MSGKPGLVPQQVVDVNGRLTTVYTTPQATTSETQRQLGGLVPPTDARDTSASGGLFQHPPTILHLASGRAYIGALEGDSENRDVCLLCSDDGVNVLLFEAQVDELDSPGRASVLRWGRGFGVEDLTDGYEGPTVRLVGERPHVQYDPTQSDEFNRVADRLICDLLETDQGYEFIAYATR